MRMSGPETPARWQRVQVISGAAKTLMAAAAMMAVRRPFKVIVASDPPMQSSATGTAEAPRLSSVRAKKNGEFEAGKREGQTRDAGDDERICEQAARDHCGAAGIEFLLGSLEGNDREYV